MQQPGLTSAGRPHPHHFQNHFITKIRGTRDGSFMSRGQLLFRRNKNSWGHSSKPSWGNEAEAQRRTWRWMVNLNKCPGFHSRRCSETPWRLAWLHACNRSLSGCFRQLTTRPALYFGSFYGFLLRKTNTKAVLTQTCQVFSRSCDSFFHGVSHPILVISGFEKTKMNKN